MGILRRVCHPWKGSTSTNSWLPVSKLCGYNECNIYTIFETYRKHSQVMRFNDKSWDAKCQVKDSPPASSKKQLPLNYTKLSISNKKNDPKMFPESNFLFGVQKPTPEIKQNKKNTEVFPPLPLTGKVVNAKVLIHKVRNATIEHEPTQVGRTVLRISVGQGTRPDVCPPWSFGWSSLRVLGPE